MEPHQGNRPRRFPWWMWLLVGLAAAAAIAYLVLDILAGTHGV